ncbi:StbB family protein [Paraburkholderia phymatum]|uniref:StbB family protein n=1 Tax=Paraburkholderia phymatum TaxID=148447 RepID=UPI00317AEDAC
MTRRHSKSIRNPTTGLARGHADAAAVIANHPPEGQAMKIVVLSHSGNVGKTTVSDHLLAPRLEGAEVISVESINADGKEAAALRGNQFAELQDRLLTIGNAVVDVGASNVEDFLMLMQRYDGSHHDFDRFVVPTVYGSKQQVDTISTLQSLQAIGVPSSKIRVVFNMVDPKQDLVRSFARLFDAVGRNGWFALDTSAVIHENPIFEKIKGTGKTIADISLDQTDYLAMNAEAIESGAPEEQRAHIRQMVALKRLAGRVTSELDAVFKAVVH